MLPPLIEVKSILEISLFCFKTPKLEVFVGDQKDEDLPLTNCGSTINRASKMQESMHKDGIVFIIFLLFFVFREKWMKVVAVVYWNGLPSDKLSQ